MLSRLALFLFLIGLGLTGSPSLFPLLGWRFWEPYLFICFYFGTGALIYSIGWFLSIVQTLPALVGKTGKELHGSEELAKEEMREIMISKRDG